MATPLPQMLTANRLRDGDVVYWRAGGWAEAFERGDVFATEADAEAALRAAGKFVADNVVVNPYLFEVRQEADGAQPVKEREIIRDMTNSMPRSCATAWSSSAIRWSAGFPAS